MKKFNFALLLSALAAIAHPGVVAFAPKKKTLAVREIKEFKAREVQRHRMAKAGDEDRIRNAVLKRERKNAQRVAIAARLQASRGMASA